MNASKRSASHHWRVSSRLWDSTCRRGSRESRLSFSRKALLGEQRAILRRAASQLSLPCRLTSGTHSGMCLPLCLDRRLALAHAAVEMVVVRRILSRSRRCPHRNTSSRWFSASALELAGVHPLGGMAILNGGPHPRNLASRSGRDVALTARLVEALNRGWTPGSGRARSLFLSRSPQET